MKPIVIIRKISLAILFLTNTMVATAQTTAPPLKQIAPGIFQIGQVRLNVDERAVRFPAIVNMTNGLVEYLIVTGTGKLHESVLRTEVEPAQIHIAMLFIGASVPTNSAKSNLAGDNFKIDFTWKTEGRTQEASGEDLVFNEKTKLSMGHGPWIYNGSKLVDGTFVAQRDGSIVAIMADPLALANSSSPDRDDDKIWFVNTNFVPPFNSPVEVRFKLEK